MTDYSVFDSLFDSIVVIDENRKICYCNEAAAALAGSSVRRLSKGAIFSDIYSLDDKTLFPVSGGESGRESSTPMQELNFVIPSSSRQGKIQVTVQPFLEANEKRWVVVMHDVTLEESLHTKYQGELEQKEGYIRELQLAKAKVEDYSKNLEQMVEERTAEVRTANIMLNAIMNSLGQGFLVFDQKGICSTVFTKACAEILECSPAHRPIWEVLRLEENRHQQFKMWMQAAFSESLPFESLVDLAPSLYEHSQKKHVTLNYYPIRGDKGTITHLVMVATDKTREYEAEQALLKEQQYIQMVLKVIKSRDQFGLFLSNTRALIQKLKNELALQTDQFDFAEAFRTLHTLEGEASLFSASVLRQVSRECQQVLEPFREGGVYDRSELLRLLKVEVLNLERVFEEFLRLNAELLDVLKVGETRNIEVSVPRLLQFADFMIRHSCPPMVYERFAEDLLKQPLTLYIRHFNEVTQHVAQTEGKMLFPIEFDCDQVRIVPGSLDSLLSTLVHAFRNAVDHGIETPDVRQENGKIEAGRIKVSANEFQNEKNQWIRLKIEDDGAGIHPLKIREVLKKRFPDKDFSNQTDPEILQTIFLPGFSSREQIGQFSGRGIGMDAIKAEVDRLGGRAKVESETGKGTRLTLEFPVPTFAESFAKSA